MLSSGCDDRKCRVLLLKGVRIGERVACPLGESGWVLTPCTRKRSPLRRSIFSGYHIRNSVRLTFLFHLLRIFHVRRLTPDGRGGRFNFPGQTYLDPLIALTRRVFLSVYNVAVFSLSFLIFPTDILRYFALDICCLNPQSLLVTHLS